ncbi:MULTISPECIES: cupin domain-containing protein [Roseobacteraceae]|uniref:Cupin domain protein n=1 Tax=Pseudosulfitobacter pseudonitzschiae TaxID=1402135 RepID=A0A221K655_9RHOB|nr:MULTISPECIES: cupin domain-containing protein [Roseobacteraceae]ASM74479.1 cupin domain protein [Pseudosulfitobacter pseudonitzschiae]
MNTENPKSTAGMVIELPPGGGRRYEMGKLTALFKADEENTRAIYSVSEWILQPGQEGVGAHSHEANDEVFFVLEGCPETRVGDIWKPYETGAFIRIPAGVVHDFRNATRQSARLLNFFIPGGFERDMPKIVEWFEQN